MEQLLTVGKIINTHGIKGEIKVQSVTDDLERFKKLKKAYIDNSEITITNCKLQPGKVILKIEGIDKIEDAVRLKNKYIRIRREDAIELPEDSYFESDIIGCHVYNENGEELGTIDDIIYTGSNDVYWIKGEKELLIPAIKSIVLNIDVESKKVIIKPLEVWQ